MNRIKVHLNALRAFEAAGRLSSISRAAEELHISHSTVSHHVKGLEQALGVPLFERRDRAVILTEEGAALLPVLTESFDAIGTALTDIMPTTQSKPLRVTVTPSFANRWLVPNLRGFRTEHEDVEVQISASLKLYDLRRENIDIAIRAGNGNWPGVDAEWLMPIRMTPMCSPSLLTSIDMNEGPASLKHLTLLHGDTDRQNDLDSEWRAWLDAAGADDIDCESGLSLHDPGLVLQAAADGLGIAMGYVELANRDLAGGQLIAPFDLQVTHPWSYYIVTPKNKRANHQVSVFRDWIKKEAASYATEE